MPRERLVLLAGVLVIGLLAGYKHALPRYRSWLEATREREWLAASRLATLRAALNSGPAIPESLEVASRRYAALAPLLLDGSNSSTAGGILLALVSAATQGPGLQPVALQTTGDSAGGRYFLTVGVRGDLTADVTGLMDFVRALESSVPRLMIRDLDITQGEPCAHAGQPEALRIRFLVQGLALRSESQ